MTNFTFVEKDTGVEMRITCLEGDGVTPIDLTDCTVTLRWKGSESDAKVERTMSVYGDPAAGIAFYIFAENELEAPLMTFEVQIVNAIGFTRTSLDPITERVRARLS